MSRLPGSPSISSPSQSQTTQDATQPPQSTSKLIPYQLEPPTWRPRLQESSSLLGPPDFYPPYPGQPEDDMSEPTVRAGISSKPVVGNETFSAHDMIYDRLKSGGITSLLGNLFTEIVARKEELNFDSIQSFEHRLPPRVTLNDFKLNSYIKDLADPTVPLYKLSKSVPHGYRGEKMLDMLWGTTSNQSGQTKLSAAINAPRPSVEIPRAVWFIRVVGATEIQSARSRPNTNYASEWTSVTTGWLRKQLNELTLTPSTVSGLNAVHGSHLHQPLSKGPPTPSRRTVQSGGYNAFSSSASREPNPLLDPESEKRWLAKWNYSLSLVRNLIQEGLLDQKIFLRWSIEMLSTANISQLPFALSLVKEDSQVYSASTMLSRLMAEGVCLKLRDLDNAQETEEFASRLYAELRGFLQEVFRSNPEIFISPRLWKKHRERLESVLGEEESTTLNPKRRQSDLEIVKSRVDSLLLADIEVVRNASACSEARTLEILDQISPSSDLSNVVAELFSDSEAPIYDKLDSILSWSCTNLRSGIHRPYAAARIFQILLERRSLFRRGKKSATLGCDPQQMLMRWLGEVDTVLSPDSTELNNQRTALLSTLEFSSIVILVGELVRLGLFAFPKYLQRLSARGLTSVSDTNSGRSTSTPNRAQTSTANSTHTRLLRSIPIYQTPAAIQTQRRSAIYGPRSKESWEEATERRAIRELQTTFTWLYSWEANLEGSCNAPTDSTILSRDAMVAALPHLWSGSRFIRVKIISEQLLPSILARPHLLNSSRLALLISVIVEAEDFSSLSEMVLSLLQVQLDPLCLSLLCSTILEHSMLWLCLGSSPLMAGYLMQLYQLSISTDSPPIEVSKTLTATLRNLAKLGWLGEEEREQSAKNQSITLEAEQTIYHGDLGQISAMLNHLLSDPRGFDNMILSLKQQESVTSPLTQAVFETTLSMAETSGIGSDYSLLLRLLDWLCLQTPCSLQSGLKRWTERELSKEELASQADTSSSSGRVCGILLEMVCKGHLSCQDIIQNLVQPCFDRFLGNVVGLAKFASPPRLLFTSLEMLRITLEIRSSTSGTLSLEQEIQLGASRSQLLVQDQRQQIIAHLLINLSALEITSKKPDYSSASPTIPAAASELRLAICSLPGIKTAVLGNLSSLIMCSRSSVKDLWGMDLQALMNKVIGSFDPSSLLLLSTPELDSDKLLGRLHPWRQKQTISEINVICERIQSVEASSANKGLAQISQIAELLYKVLFALPQAASASGEECITTISEKLDDALGTQLLQTASSQVLILKLMEASLKDSLASFEAGRAAQLSSISPAVRIQRSSTLQSLPIQPSETVMLTFKHVCQSLSSASQDVRESNSPQGSQQDSLVLGLLRLLSLLLNLNVSWPQSCKDLFPTLLPALLDLSLKVSRDEEDGNLFEKLLDLIGFTQEELPPDIQTNVVSTFTLYLESRLEDSPNSNIGIKQPGTTVDPGLPLSKSNANRIRSLALPLAQNTIFRDLILSKSMCSASISDFTPAPNKPWNLLEYVEIPANSSQVATSTSNGISASSPPSTGPYVSLPISNKSSLSLTSFSAHASRDNPPSPPPEDHEVELLLTSYRHTSLSTPPANETEVTMENSNLNNQLPVVDPKIGYRFFESERSYGNWKGGEPIYARDWRRGQVGAGHQDEIEERIKQIRETEEEEQKKKKRAENEKREKDRRAALAEKSQKSHIAPAPAPSKATGASRPKPKASAGAKAAQKLKEEEEERRKQEGMEVDVNSQNGNGGAFNSGKKRKSMDDEE